MKKDPIDKLFEEKLKDYSELPENRVWKSIEASLNKKKKSRKLIPVWWKLGGAAAILALVFYLLNPLGSNQEPVVPVSDIEEVPSPVFPNKEKDIPTLNDKESNPVTAAPDRREDSISSQATTINNANAHVESTIGQDKGLTGDREEAIAPQQSAGTNIPVGISDKEAVASAQGKAPSNLPDESIKKVVPDQPQELETSVRNPPSLAIKEPVAKENQEEASQPDKTALSLGQNQEVVAETKEEDPSAGKSIFDEISESAQEDQQSLAADEASRWSVGPKLAPVYFNSFGQGSPIHSSFIANSKSGNVNLSYGLSLAYNITPKLSIRSGVHKVEYGYDTNDISFSPAFALSTGQQIDNINYTLTARNLVVRNASQAKAAQDALAAEVSAEFPERNGRMVQQFGYVEVPLELNLALIDSKLGLHLIGGLSSLFLVDNSVTLESQGNSTEMGEANNLNPVNFSTNVGFGLEYELSKKIQLNLEPVFKYQLNTFSDLEGNFNPYSIGVYSGLNFKF